MSGNIAGALQLLGAIPNDGVDCTSGICVVNPIMDAGPASNETQQRLQDCAKSYYTGGTTATRVATLVAAIPFPKSWLGFPSALGSGSFTNLPSWLSLGAGTAASGSNLLRIGGRMAGPIAIASGVIDASAIALCTADYIPNFLYTVAKYDPF
jgi:hypothetical protein